MDRGEWQKGSKSIEGHVDRDLGRQVSERRRRGGDGGCKQDVEVVQRGLVESCEASQAAHCGGHLKCVRAEPLGEPTGEVVDLASVEPRVDQAATEADDAERE